MARLETGLTGVNWLDWIAGAEKCPTLLIIVAGVAQKMVSLGHMMIGLTVPGPPQRAPCLQTPVSTFIRSARSLAHAG